MPGNYICLDNFFQKMTNLESPRKNNDCYFYYYSTCKKGDNCTFRHEPSALGCETTCSFWKEGKCINVHCNFRHMELRKNRKSIPCYWETQPSGCKKPHCPFMHVSKREGDLQNDANANVESDDASSTVSKKDDFSAPVVDPIVVKFEEESDNESSTTTQVYHLKTRNQSHDLHLQVPQGDQLDYEPLQDSERSARIIAVGAKQRVAVKTLEEIKLDRIQAESAAYYSYSDGSPDPEATGRGKSVFKRLQPLEASEKQKAVNIESIKVLTLDEIRKRKRGQPEKEDIERSESDHRQDIKKQKTQINSAADATRPKKTLVEKPRKDISEIKIKTLAELKAERLQKRKLQELSEDQSICEQPSKKGRTEVDDPCEDNESEVSSTSKSEDNATVSTCNSHVVYDTTTKVQCVVAPLKRPSEKETELKSEDACSDKSQEVSENSADEVIQRVAGKDTMSEANESKLDELLLEDDDDDETCITPAAEDDILKEIDSFLND